MRTVPSAGRRSTGPAETYTSQARRDEQPRLTDLIPIRYRTLTLIYAIGLLIVAGLEVLYFHIDSLAAHVVREALGAFDLASRGSFAAWYASLLLSVMGVTAALLFSLRRHRIDDYRGRYRIWLWATLGYLALAVNQTADLDALLCEMVEQAAARVGMALAWMWPALCLTVGLACLLRFSFEVRRSRGALALGWLGAVEWLLASTGVGRLTPELPARQVMLAVGLRLLGQLTILAAHIAYARYVLLDAHGLLNGRAKTDSSQARRRKTAEKALDTTVPAKAAIAARTDLDPPTLGAQPPAALATAETPDSASPAKLFSKSTLDSSDEQDDDSDGSQGLTRAERKRLRRERKLERRNAA